MSKRATNEITGICIYDKECNIDIIQLKNDCKALLQYIKENAEKENWNYSIYIAGSEHNGAVATKWAKRKYVDGKACKGRDKFEFYLPKGEKGKVRPHLHFIIKANPAETIMQECRKYWEGKFGKNKYFYDRGDNGFIRYMWKQATFGKFDGYDPDGIIDNADYKIKVKELQRETVALSCGI